MITLRSVSPGSYLLLAGQYSPFLLVDDQLVLMCRDGHYGLYLDASLLDGSSALYPTFNNPVLCSCVDIRSVGIKKDVSYECVGLEVWGVGP